MKISRTIAIGLFVNLLTISASAQTFIFHLRGDQEVPTVPSTATGGCMGVLDQGTAQFSVTCVHNVAGATVMHIHRGDPGVNGPILFDLGNPNADPVTATWTGMTAGDIDDLINGHLYINIHTAGRPSGEIRGQILSRTVDFVPFNASGAQTVPPNGGAFTASCTADLDGPATAIAVQCTHNLPSPASAHIHEAPFGEIGPTVFTFASPASPLNASIPVTPRQVADFAATFLYLDVHGSGGTEEDPADEIRGQIGTPPAGAGTGTIVINKSTSPGGGTGFTFTETITPGGFALDDGGTETFAGVAPGTYTVTESDPSSLGYAVGGISCDDANSSGNPFDRIATIRLDAGEVVTCTFDNFEVAPTDSLFVFHLSGDQEVPPIATNERGGCMARFDSGAKELTLICTHDVVLPTVIYIHQGAAGVNGPIIFDLGDPTSPVTATWSGMTPTNIADLFSENLYINIHTSGRPSGAIRGQIVERSVDTVAFAMDTAQVVPPGSPGATGNCTADLSTDATQLAVSCTHTLPSPDVAHVHDAPRGQNGPVAFTFPSAASPFAASVPMTPRLVADFAAQFLYVDVHGVGGSEETPADQIRGQIGAPPVVVTTGTIHIVKTTSPAGGTGFSFTDNVPGSPGTFTLDHGGTESFTNVPAGTYTIAELDPASSGYSLTDVTCSDANSDGNPFARTATVRLEAGETVTCTFRNLQSVAAPTRFVFHLSGSQEVPPTNSTATGGCYGELNAAAARFALVCSHTVSSPVIAHIHRGAAGVNGPIAFDVGDPSSPIETTWTGMTPADISELLAGNLYLNIHASGRPDGEIRGQILPRTVDNFSFPLTAAQEVPPTDSTATGNCTADLSNDAASLIINCNHTVVPTDIHLHAAPPGFDGPVVFAFSAGTSFGGNVPMTPRLIADFAGGLLYVNVHSAAYETGEIRGQVAAGAPALFGAPDAPTLSEWASLLMLLSVFAIGLWRTR